MRVCECVSSSIRVHPFVVVFAFSIYFTPARWRRRPVVPQLFSVNSTCFRLFRLIRVHRIYDACNFSSRLYCSLFMYILLGVHANFCLEAENGSAIHRVTMFTDMACGASKGRRNTF